MAWFFPFTADNPPLLMGEMVCFEQSPFGLRKLASGEKVFGPVTEASFR